MILNKNPQDDGQNDPHDDGAFGGAFGGSFGGAFEVKFHSDGSTSKTAAKEKPEAVTEEKPAKKPRKGGISAAPVAPARTSSRTFVAAEEIKKEPAKRSSSTDTWMEELARTYEKKKAAMAGGSTVTTAPSPVSTPITQSEPKPTPVTASAPTPYRSKIITAEEKKAKENTPPVTSKTASDDRGIAFAKTFLKGSGTAFRRPTTSYTPRYAPQSGRPPYGGPRIPRKKVKNAPTLKTRVSGKSAANVLELKKLVGDDIRDRAPVVVIMGHVDHGKSTLLDYIRKSNTAEREVGGITQKMSAYEIVHNDKKITFLDTPGHEAFNSMRTRGARAADIAILVVSAEDGVKPQTIDALKSIQEAGVPYFIGASKIDRDGADVNKTKQSLAENEIFVEGYGGDVSLLPFSGKTGEGVDDLLDMILLMAEVADIKAAYDVPAECLVIESGRDKVRGIHATLIVKNGTLKIGSFIVSGGEVSPVRIIENFEGKAIKEALPGQPVRLVGWVGEPHVGDICVMCTDKAIAELVAAEQKEMLKLTAEIAGTEVSAATKIANLPANIRALYGLETDDTWTLPIVLKADSVGTLDALKLEISKIQLDRINLRVIRAETGDINENDIKLAQGSKDSVVLGYNTKVDAQARRVGEQTKTTIETFDIIYKLSEWLTEEARKRAPKITSEESHGTLKILKVFSANKHKQVLGGRVETGKMHLGDQVTILRRDNEIGRGEIVELQQARSAVKSVETDSECGLMVESKIEIVPGDVLSAVSTVER